MVYGKSSSFFVMILFYPGQFSNKDVCSPSLPRQKVVNLIQLYVLNGGFLLHFLHG